MSSSHGGRRILVTLPDAAWPVDGGKRLRCNGVLRGLAAAGEVDVAVLFAGSSGDGSPVPPDVALHDWTVVDPAPRGRLTGAVASLARGLPMHVGAQRWDVVRDRLAPWTGRRYDLVWFGGLDHARGLGDLFPGPRRVVDCDDVETDKWRAYLDAGGGDPVERLQRRVELPLWRRIQSDVAGWADAVAVCSDLDARRFGAGQTVVVPNTYPEPADPAPAPAPRAPGAARMVMIANWGTDQNVDAARHAARDLLPRVRELLPDARLRLVGRRAERIAEVARAAGVDVVGAVPEVSAELAAADVVVVPMRFGGGTRLKILEAFAHRVPVVSTRLGCEGLHAEDGVHLLVRDDPAEFAAAVRDVVTDAALRDRLVGNGHDLYERDFRPQAAVDAVRALVERLVP